MEQKSGEYKSFDTELAVQCTQAFSDSVNLGCTLSDKRGTMLCECGYGCERCGLCAAGGMERRSCAETHIYSMNAAERFGGKYIYFCPVGLAFFVSPIVGALGVEAKITVGPFVMVEKEDFLEYELGEALGFSPDALRKAAGVLESIPFVEPHRVQQLSLLLFMAVGFLNDFTAESRMMEADRSGELQGQITSYILELKQQETPPPYPFETEHALLKSIAHQNREESQRLLNELLGAILFASGGNLEQIKSRLFELLVLISRTAIDHGSDAAHTLELCDRYRREIGQFTSVDALCYWLSSVVKNFMQSLFDFSDAKHEQIIRQCIQYIGANYSRKLTLDELAGMVYLSPAYLSRIFKRETGVNFSEYLNQVRIEKAKELLRMRDIRMTDIALLVGYEDQSYFTRVFKRITGVLPRIYREKKISKEY